MFNRPSVSTVPIILGPSLIYLICSGCRVVLKMNPTAVHSILERVTTEDDEGAEDHSLEEEEEEGAAHSLKDVCDFGKPEPSPFSSRRVMYENEEVGYASVK